MDRIQVSVFDIKILSHTVTGKCCGRGTGQLLARTDSEKTGSCRTSASRGPENPWAEGVEDGARGSRGRVVRLLQLNQIRQLRNELCLCPIAPWGQAHVCWVSLAGPTRCRGISDSPRWPSGRAVVPEVDVETCLFISENIPALWIEHFQVREGGSASGPNNSPFLFSFSFFLFSRPSFFTFI